MMSDSNDNNARSRRRRQRRGYALLILAAGMLAFGAAAGTLYYMLRPTTLRIAVGPPGSEDQKLIQLMAQTFARDASAIRLAPIATPGAAESIALFTAGKADLAVARGDLNLPANAESVAILRNSKSANDARSPAATGRGEPKFLPIEVAETISKKHPIYESEEIPGSIFASSPARPDDKVETASVNHLSLAPKALSEISVDAF